MTPFKPLVVAVLMTVSTLSTPLHAADTSTATASASSEAARTQALLDRAEAHVRAQGDPALASLLQTLTPPQACESVSNELPPLVLTRIASPRGELNFMSTFTTFGMPQDITLTSLRIEHLIPADEPTWQVMRAAYAEHAALVL